MNATFLYECYTKIVTDAQAYYVTDGTVLS